MTKVTVEANAATDVVEAIYPASLGDSVAAGRYAVTGVDDYCVAHGSGTDRGPTGPARRAQGGKRTGVN